MADRVSNPGPLALESDALLTALRGPARYRLKYCLKLWGLFGHFFLSSIISLFFLPRSGRRPDTDVKYRLKYCLTGPLSPTQPTKLPGRHWKFTQDHRTTRPHQVISGDGLVIMKGCVLWNLISGRKDFRLMQGSKPGSLDQQGSS